MSDTKIIVFSYRHGHGEHNTLKEEVEFDINATEEEINEVYTQWVLEVVGEKCTWYEKES